MILKNYSSVVFEGNFKRFVNNRGSDWCSDFILNIIAWILIFIRNRKHQSDIIETTNKSYLENH